MLSEVCSPELILQYASLYLHTKASIWEWLLAVTIRRKGKKDYDFSQLLWGNDN